MSDTSSTEVMPVNGDQHQASAKNKLAQTIADVMAEIGSIEKNGKNDYHGYEYATDDDVMSALRPTMAEHGLVALPSVVKRETVEEEDENGDVTFHTYITLQIRLIDAGSGQSETMTWEGEAQDTQDKGLYKAMTSGVKYWALKTFLLSADTDVETNDIAGEKKGSNPSSGRSSTRAPTDAQLEYAADLYDKPVWSEGEKEQLRSRVQSSTKSELSDLIDQMKETIEKRQNGN